MLTQGRLPMTEAEEAAVEKLLKANPDAAVSMTRRDPEEQGPLLVHVDDKTWEISEDGSRKKVA